MSKIFSYRRGVGMVIMNAAGMIFVGQRGDTHDDTWQMPQGGIDLDERPLDAVFRELREETSILPQHIKILAESSAWISYDFPETIQKKAFGGTFQGQKQKWFLMKFEGKDTDINVKTASPEFRAWKWISPQLIPFVAIFFKRELYRDIFECFEEDLERITQDKS